jgi:hypothetical protein
LIRPLGATIKLALNVSKAIGSLSTANKPWAPVQDKPNDSPPQPENRSMNRILKVCLDILRAFFCNVAKYYRPLRAQKPGIRKLKFTPDALELFLCCD